MGAEAACTMRVGRAKVAGKALLESDHLLFRGDGRRVKVLFADLKAVTAKGGVLTLDAADGAHAFELGEVAEKWAEKIRNPKSVLDKLGVKDGMRVAVIGVDDEDFLDRVRARVPDVTIGKAGKELDLLFFGTEDAAGLARLATLKASLRSNGAVWVVHRKGKGAPLKDVDVFAAAKRAGLVDVKVVGFSATHTAEKLVIPLAKR